MISLREGQRGFDLRAAAVLYRGDAVLLHRLVGDPVWALPGGRVEWGETAEQAVVRELREELGVALRPLRLLWVVENFFQHDGLSRQEVSFYWLAEPTGPCLLTDTPGPYIGSEPGSALEFAWWPLAQLPGLDLRPAFLAEALRHPADALGHRVVGAAPPVGTVP